jgi:Ca-activated chloride channel family protein
VGARYVPPHTVTSRAAAADANAVTAPIANPALGKSINPVSITVHLAPGFAPANVTSPYHRINVAQAGPMAKTVTLAQGEEPADRDFELRWRSASADPTLALFHQSLNGQQYLMAAITPPATRKIGAVPPREMVFVIDNSGSMGGASMDAAKESLDHALDTLRPEDRFNVIRFDDTMTQLFEHAMQATPDQVVLAKRYADGLEAAGGTEMLPALKAALADDGSGPAVRQVVFLTDGDLSNEREMMAEIAAHGGRSRVFMVGIGSAPNTHLMRRMAEAGRGTYTNIGDGAEVNAKMSALLERLRTPAVHDLAVRVDGPPLDLTPRQLPDLYAGEPLMLLGKGDKLSGKLTVSGLIGDRPWSESIDLAAAEDSPAVAKLWANRRIGEVEAQRASGQIEDGVADEAVAKLGQDYGIVTRQTSLVAEDATPSRPAGARLTREELPLLLPAGWDFDTLFGLDAASGAAPAPEASAADQSDEMDVPQTATGFVGLIGRGLGMLGLGLAGLLALGRSKGARA